KHFGGHMKKIALATLALVSTFAFARSPMRPAPLEPVTVKSVTMVGDFMPPLPPGSSGKPGTIIVAQVNSNGCTDASSFVVTSKPVTGGQSLSIIRLKPDNCRAFFPEGIEVELTTDF